MYSRPIEQLINAFEKLPSVGQRTAERYVFWLLKSGRKNATELMTSLKQLLETVKSCEQCWDFSDISPCRICTDAQRDAETICVVCEPQDLQAIERLGQYKGRYHILRGTIRADEEESIRYLKIPELLDRAIAEKITEVILALNHDMHGETTMIYLEQKLKEKNATLRVSRLARGLPMGSDLQYADEITLGSALKHRTQT